MIEVDYHVTFFFFKLAVGVMCSYAICTKLCPINNPIQNFLFIYEKRDFEIFKLEYKYDINIEFIAINGNKKSIKINEKS